MAGKLFLGGISPTTTKELIDDHFSKYGNVIDSVVMYKDGKPRGFGFVTFDNLDAAYAALADEQFVDGRVVDVKEAVPQDQSQRFPVIAPHRAPPAIRGGAYVGAYISGRTFTEASPAIGSRPRPTVPPPAALQMEQLTDKVFIGGLPQSSTEDMLLEHFSQYGNIIDVVVMRDRASQRSRGFGFVQYDNLDSAEMVMADFSKHHIDGKWVECKRAVPQDRMAAPPSYGGYQFRARPY
uniref:RRM domain-containing protein n=1 Tax=Noctiluca scintillans TaxID=2966 RepID=A0A7S1A933_NOCSC